MRELRRTALGTAVVVMVILGAFSPALFRGDILAPGDGTFVHLPLRSAVFASWSGGDLPAWSFGTHLGTPLLASYLPGSLHPLMLTLSLLDPWTAFQLLVILSILASGVFTCLCARAYGSSGAGAVAAGLFFGLGPAMIGRLGDTPAIVAAPHLPLLLLCTERVLRGSGQAWGVLLAAGVAGLLLAGSPDMALAGGLTLAVRLLLGIVGTSQTQRAHCWQLLPPLAGGILLAAPQWLPTLLAWPGSTGFLSPTPRSLPPSFARWLVQQLSHSPAATLCLAGLPLAVGSVLLRVILGGAAVGVVVVSLAPFGAASAPLLVLDLLLALGGGVTLSRLLAYRHDAIGRRARIWYLLACIASAAALSVAATTLGPLPQTLAGAVGALTVAQIVFFVGASSESPRASRLFLLPLALALGLQPSGRGAWEGGLRRATWERGSATRDAVARRIAWRTEERMASVARVWPERDAVDLGFGNLGLLAGRRDAGGIGGLVPRSREVATGLDAATGLATTALVSGEPGRLAFQGVRFLQVAVPELGVLHEASPSSDVEIEVRPERRRLVPFPISTASAVRLESALSDAVDVEAGTVVADLTVRLAAGRTVVIPVRAGIETGEWARHRLDVRDRIRHPVPTAAEVVTDARRDGERYSVRLPLSGRVASIDAVGIEVRPGRSRLSVFRLGLADEATGLTVWATRLAGFVSDTHAVREAAATPFVRFYEVRGSLGRGRVVSSLTTAPDERGLRGLLAAPVAFGIDPRRTAVATQEAVGSLRIPEGSRSGSVEVSYPRGRAIDVRAEGPGLLVVGEGWAPGWQGRLDGREAEVFRVNGGLMATPLAEGRHLFELRYSPPGFRIGLGLAVVGLGALALGWLPLTRRRLTVRANAC